MQQEQFLVSGPILKKLFEKSSAQTIEKSIFERTSFLERGSKPELEKTFSLCSNNKGSPCLKKTFSKNNSSFS
jgi:hypothetical protein